MTTSLKKIKSIKKEIQFTVFGYMRQSENELSLFCNITEGIYYICLAYYYLGEYFEKAGDDIRISDDQMTITKMKSNACWKNTSYGNIWIDSWIHQIVEWRFKINSVKRD